MSSDGRLRIRCRATTALCTLAPLLAFAASPARAADECGPVPLGGGTVECPTANYPDGISYDAGVEDLTVVVDSGSTVESGFSLVGDSDLSAILDGVSVSSTDDFENAVSVDSGSGQLILRVADATSSGDGAAGVYTRSDGSYAALYSGNVSTSGDGSTGVEAIGDAGYQVVVADFTTTTGQDSAGVSVGTKAGDVFAMTFGVETSGDYSAGIQISSASGDIVSQSGQHIILGQVTTHGDHSDAIDLSTVDGDITSRSQFVTSSGDGSAGIHAVSGTGNIAIYNGFNTSDGSINTYGTQSDGIHAETGGNIGIVSDSVHTRGPGSDGIEAISSGGSIFISSNSIETDAAASRGIAADAAQDLSIVSGTISTSGRYDTGIEAVSRYGNISIDSSDLTTNGGTWLVNANATGISASARYGSIDVNAGNVSVYGVGSQAMKFTAGGNIKVKSGDVTTHSQSFGGDGIIAYAYGNVDISTADLDIYASHSVGVLAYAHGAAQVVTGDVKVSHSALGGYSQDSYGIIALALNGPATVSAQDVTVAGEGIIAETLYGDVSVTAGNIAISGGSHASGVQTASFIGDISIQVGSVVDSSEETTGISAGSYGYGDIDVSFDSVLMTAYRGGGVSIFSGADSSITLSGDSVETFGDESLAVFTYARGKDLSADLNSIVTHGDFSAGVALNDNWSYDPSYNIVYGDIRAKIGAIRTSGYGSDALAIITDSSDVDVDVGTIRTGGDRSVGIGLRSVAAHLAPPNPDYGGGYYGTFFSRPTDFVIDFDSIETAGNYSTGVIGYLQMGDIHLTGDSIRTHGDFASGIVLSSGFSLGPDPAPEIFDIDVGTIETDGAAANGIIIYGNPGAIDIDVDSVVTHGANASGIIALGLGDITINAGMVDLQGTNEDSPGFSTGVYGVTSGGNVHVSASEVHTSGDNSNGVIAASNGRSDYYGNTHVGEVAVDVGTVTTKGDYSIGVAATSSGGSVTLHAGSVETEGDYSIGVAGNALAFTPGYGASDQTLHGGDLTVVVGDAVTHGDHSDGVSALGFSGGDTNVTVGTVETSGDDSYGLNVVSSGQANYYTGGFYSGATTVTVDKVATSGTDSTGIRVFAFTGDIDLTAGSVDASGENSDAVTATNGSDGSVVVNILDHAISRQGFGVAASAYDNVDVNIGEGAHVFGGKVGVYAGAYSDGASAHIFNQGEIATGGDGVAILAIGQGVTIDNRGAVIGPVWLTDHDDLFDNSGAWQSFGANRFGAGDDLVLNSGTLRIGSGVAGQEIDWSNLETLDNSGLVTLADGHADQIFDLNATSFVGNAGSKLALDIGATPHGLTSDLMQVGAASGSTQLQLSGTGGIGRTLVVDAESSTGAGNFFLTGGAADLGFLRMTLDYDAAKSDWTLVGAPDQEAFEGVRFGAQAQSLWRRSIDTWSRAMDEAPAPERFTLWGRYLTGHEEQHSHPAFRALGVDYSPSLNTDAQWDGALVGASFGRGGWSWGALLGVTEQTARFTFDDNKLRAKGTNFGAYAGWTGGTLFARAVANYQHVRARADLRTAATDDTLHGSVTGVRGEAGLDLALGAMRVRPLVSLTWTHGRLDDLRAPGAALDFHGFTSLEGSAGASLSGTLRAAMTVIHPYAGLYAVHEFAGDNALDLNIGSQSLRLVDQPQSDHAKATAGFAADLGGAFRLSVGGEAEFFGGRSALKGQIGLSWHG